MTSKSQLLRCWLEILSLGGPTSGGEDLVRHSNFLIQWWFQHQDILPLNSANHLGDLSENQCTPWTRAYASALSVSLSSAPLPYSSQLILSRDIYIPKRLSQVTTFILLRFYSILPGPRSSPDHTFCPKGFRMIQGFVWAYDLGLI